MAHNPFPFTRDSHPHLTAAIRGVMSESQSATKTAIADFMHSLPAAAVQELKTVMKTKSLGRRYALINKTLKAHGISINQMSGLGSFAANVVNDYFDTFFGGVNESHTRAQLEKMSVTRLRELKKKYEGLVLKGDKGASRELADIRGLLRSKGAGVVVDEAASPCEKAAAKRLRDANAEDLKEKQGAAGAAAHKRLHKTIKGILGTPKTAP